MSSRKSWVALALSLAIPGLGHVYAGTFGIAVAIGAFERLAPAAVDLLAGAGAISVKTLAVLKLVLPLVVRLSAAVHAIVAARAPQPLPPPGAYGFYTVGWFVAAFALGHLTAPWVAAVPLTEGGHGLKAGDRVLTTRLGAAETPKAGELAVWFADWPDGGRQPLVPALRQVRVGRISAIDGGSFVVDGQPVPGADYGGLPLGVLSAPSADGRSLDWSRVGIVPAR